MSLNTIRRWRRSIKDIRRADDVMAGLEFWISRRAEICYAVENHPPDVAFWISKRTQEGRARVIFSFQEEAAYLLTAWLIPDRLEGLFFEP